MTPVELEGFITEAAGCREFPVAVEIESSGYEWADPDSDDDDEVYVEFVVPTVMDETFGATVTIAETGDERAAVLLAEAMVNSVQQTIWQTVLGQLAP